MTTDVFSRFATDIIPRSAARALPRGAADARFPSSVAGVAT